MIGIIGGGLCGLGALLVLLGAYLSVREWKLAHAAAVALPGEYTSEAAGAAEILEGLAKFFTAIGKFPLGRYLIAVGFALILFGSIVSTVGAITA